MPGRPRGRAPLRPGQEAGLGDLDQGQGSVTCTEGSCLLHLNVCGGREWLGSDTWPKPRRDSHSWTWAKATLSVFFLSEPTFAGGIICFEHLSVSSHPGLMAPVAPFPCMVFPVLSLTLPSPPSLSPPMHHAHPQPPRARGHVSSESNSGGGQGFMETTPLPPCLPLGEGYLSWDRPGILLNMRVPGPAPR